MSKQYRATVAEVRRWHDAYVIAHDQAMENATARQVTEARAEVLQAKVAELEGERELWEAQIKALQDQFEAEANHLLIRAQTAETALNTAKEEIGRLREDAERWRAFISSDRFYVMGSAGFTYDGGPPTVRPDHNPDDWLHFTLNVWDKHPAGNDAQGVHGRQLLLAYVEHRRAALSTDRGGK